VTTYSIRLKRQQPAANRGEMMDLHDSIIKIKGIGKAKETLFHSLNIFTVRDLLEYYPVSYEDCTQVQLSSHVFHGNKALLKGEIIRRPEVQKIRKNLTLTKAVAQDESGQFQVVWYNIPYINTNILLGNTYYFYGKVSNTYGNLQLEMPEYENIHKASKLLGIIPKYGLTKGLSQRDVRNGIAHVLNSNISINDYLPKDVIDQFRYAELSLAYRNIHVPDDFTNLLKAKNRLILNEFLEIQLAFRYMKDQSKGEAIPFSLDDHVRAKVESLLSALPFQLTDSQKKVLEELYEDLRDCKQMNRMVQGDVGSGKTIIAVIMLYICYLNGYQGVMMVPTEILAEQHYQYISDLFCTLNIDCKVALMTKFKSTKVRLETLQNISSGNYDVIVATHGVIQDDVEFPNLGLVVTDEQHRFGVKQRKQLTNKGKNPHVMVMSATPIPRTISLALYGDLDVSTIDVMPVGRKSIETYSVNNSYKDRIYKFMLKEISNGRQAYILCPSIEANEKLNSAEEVYERLKSGVFKDIQMSMLHGKMSSSDKEKIMRSFYDNENKVLVCTTVVEVGINVPNATIMLIENTERFGLAQLHQLRGRVGRGNHQSYCILLTDSKKDTVQERIKVLVESTDGFYISQKDLELRGPGDYFGFHQHGLPSFKLADISKHQDILKDATCIADLIESKIENETIKKEILAVFNNKLRQISMN